jgi:acyl-ACP thioesterase
MPAQPTLEFVAAPPGTRVFTQDLRPGLSDCTPSGRIRLDALARWLQDVAYADVEDAGLADSAVWVIRRARLRVHRFPRFHERFTLATFCSGIGRMWAERRTTISRDDHVDVDAVAVWVHLDAQTHQPARLTEGEMTTYGGGVVPERRVSARLRHPAPPPRATIRPWQFRTTECDLAGHINNSAYWQPLEDELLAGPEPAAIDVEIEHRTPAAPGPKQYLGHGPWRWLVDGDGQPHASMLVSSAAS